MLWLSASDATAPALPAAWLIATDQRPASLPERSALRRALAREILARQLDLPAEAVTIGHEPAGRPVIAAPHGTGLHLSLATRAGLVAVALARHPVGIDVERVDPATALPLETLHPGERQMLLELAPPARPLAFARLWSAKEAYVKALGTGFVRAPESFQVRLLGQDGFEVEEPQRPQPVRGHGRITKNGGHEGMAAAVIVLDRARLQPG
jgi:4'-phosphopantetheinyl transferase